MGSLGTLNEQKSDEKGGGEERGRQGGGGIRMYMDVLESGFPLSSIVIIL